ncbi:hypothetical protein [Methylorubrum sp. Q1]|uniref:hypothetical protein n=1 Tax=Methylorubrum sp. Q1 TaxID=2562453 RepID=UPI00187D17CF|nr:hypothetical protein [Methylorubrum sp. Q1]
MSKGSPSRYNQLTSMTDSMRLQKLVDALGVPETAFEVLKEFRHLTADADGNLWLLILDMKGKLVVRRIGEDGDQHTMEERVSVFLRRNGRSPLRDARAALIGQRLLVIFTD